MNEITIRVCGKVNISLEVESRVNDRHNLDMIFASTGNIYDTITVRKREDDKLIFNCDDERVPASNTATKMYHLYNELTSCGGAEITLKKMIPFEGGLGGSSAGGAGVLACLMDLYKPLEISVQKQLCSKIGSDVFYMIDGGFVRAKGIGDDITKIKTTPLCSVLIKPVGGVLTGKCFELYKNDSVKYEKLNDKLEKMLINYKDIDLKTIAGLMHNDLLNSSLMLNDNIKPCMDLLYNSGALRVNLSGSGSCVFGVYDNYKDSEKAYNQLLKKVNDGDLSFIENVYHTNLF